jgi:hypothetical protein
MSTESQPRATLPRPWDKFLQEVDELLGRPVEIHCLGGFVLIVLYGREIPTGDIDYIEAIPPEEVTNLERLAGRESKLASKYGVYFQFVPVGGIADVPENYATRLIDLFPARFSKLRLQALDPYDLILSKVTRNAARDERDVAFLASKRIIDPVILEERYREELRPNLVNEERHDLTLRLWVEGYFQ